MPRDDDAPPADAPPAPPVRRGLFGRLRNYFLTGLIVTAPLGITIWILLGVVELIDDSVAPLLPPAYTPQFYVEKYLGVEAHIPGVGLVAVLVGLTAIGLLTANFVGRMVVRTGESLLGRIPVVRSVYGALKQIFQTVLENSSRSFREVVLVEYPRRGIWAIGFITSATEGEVQTTIADEVVNVFLPTTPNPHFGLSALRPARASGDARHDGGGRDQDGGVGGDRHPARRPPGGAAARARLQRRRARARGGGHRRTHAAHGQPERRNPTARSRSNR